MKANFWGQNTHSLLRLLLLITFVSTTTPLQAQTKDATQVGTWENKDEDGDGVINTYDKNDKSYYAFNKSTQLYNVTMTTEGLSLTNRFKPTHRTKLHFSGNLSDDVILVLSKS